MMNNEQNTVLLSKTAYDTMRGTNDRASMLLREIMESIAIDNCDSLTVDCSRVITAIKVLYPDTYKKKISSLKAARTKNQMKGL